MNLLHLRSVTTLTVCVYVCVCLKFTCEGFVFSNPFIKSENVLVACCKLDVDLNRKSLMDPKNNIDKFMKKYSV